LDHTDEIVPRDARLISLILASKGIQDAEDRVLHQLLDFAHRYTADVLQSAQVLADHAGRNGRPVIEKEDVELAIAIRQRMEFVEGPPRDYLASLAHDLNSRPLPILTETFELVRLPPPHQCISNISFDLVLDPTAIEIGMEESESSSSDEESDELPTDDDVGEDGDGDVDVEEDGDGDGDEEGDGDRDEEMEEIDVDVVIPGVRDREIDEDYDV
ncbi:hypothetical protein TREMEDRAFT_32628, partial [Tremella mesenterica DSM 1558]|uniref:uncharacterized protein n=1 Tax=Tremella mesenterica (strain ATCC 24925 / CBS 8224 / DSM 1558 / NBRC 9311 / NRRL Y-6157 / RJB 2259-6 / UBC 559-6) TaxID=578456 RepID=UPI0003F4A074